MKFFVDTADIDDIRELADAGLVDGVTTNPSLVAKAGRDFMDILKDICDVVDGPVSAEVTALDAAGMIAQGEKLAKTADNIAVKVPLTIDGLKTCRHLSNQGIMVNVTLCFSSVQALMAGKAGATFISPFVGRLDDLAIDGMDLIADIRQIYDNYDSIDTEILVASIRNPTHVSQAALMGADVCTIPPSTLRQLVKHPLTDNGLAAFMADWEKTGQQIES